MLSVNIKKNVISFDRLFLLKYINQYIIANTLTNILNNFATVYFNSTILKYKKVNFSGQYSDFFIG